MSGKEVLGKALNHKKVFLKGLTIFPVALLLLSACQAKPFTLKQPLEEEGEVYLYTEPFPQESQGISFTIESISAGRNGDALPLNLFQREFKADALKRQRLIAAGTLPPGEYPGFRIKVKRATIRTEEGEADLHVPEDEVRLETPFTISRGRSLLVSLVFRYAESIGSGMSFTPSFSVQVPRKPVIGVVGYVSNAGDNNITVFDKISMEAVSYIATGRGPTGVAMDAVRRRAYVALSGGDAIDVIDVTVGNVINRIRLNLGDRPQEMVLTQDGKTLVVVNAGSNTVSFINPIGLFEVSRINVDTGPNSILLDRTGRRAFVFNSIANTVSVIDIPNRALITSISTEPGPLRGQQNTKGDRLYIIHDLSPYMIVLDAQSFTFVKRVYVGYGMSSIKVDTNTDYIYVGGRTGPVVNVFDPFSFSPIDLISTGEGADYMTIDGEENNFYFLNNRKRSVAIFNVVSRRAISEIDVGDSPYWVAIMGER